MENALNKLFKIIFFILITHKLLPNSNAINSSKSYDEQEV